MYIIENQENILTLLHKHIFPFAQHKLTISHFVQHRSASGDRVRSAPGLEPGESPVAR